MSEQILANIRTLKKEFSGQIKEYEALRKELLECYREILELLNNATYKPRRDSIDLAIIESFSYGPGNVYTHREELRFADGELKVFAVTIYHMNASCSEKEVAGGDDAVEYAVKILEKYEDIENRFDKIVTEIANSLDRTSNYFKNRNKKLVKKIEAVRKALKQ